MWLQRNNCQKALKNLAQQLKAVRQQHLKKQNPSNVKIGKSFTISILGVHSQIMIEFFVNSNRLFKNQMEVEFHAVKSGHSNFSESTEEKKPLTEEEKKEQLARLEEKLRQKRLERDEREKQDALEKERVRIKSGKDLLNAQRRIEELEMKKLVEQRKREKQEERTARERVRAQIESDKLARKAAMEGQV